MFDLTTLEGVESALSPTPFAASDVRKLSGGWANFTYRINLREPYVHDGSKHPVRTLVLKHAEPYVAVDRSFPFAVERQDFESMAFKFVPLLISPFSAVSVPELYYHDSVNHALLMSDCGDASTTLKALLQTNPPGEDVSRIIGHSLGTFLARLHHSTSELGSPGGKIKAIFTSNHQARSIYGLLTYGRLVDTICPEDESHHLIEPPLNLSLGEIDRLSTLAKTMQNRVMTCDDVLTMGDFWPGNLIVSLDPEPHVVVVDWEAAKPGLAGLDIGQFLAEMSLLPIFHPDSRHSVDAIVSSFLTAYREASPEDSAFKQNMTGVAWDAATHIGQHLVVWTPRVPWGSKEKTRSAVKEGVDYLLHALDRNGEWLEKSLVGGLLL